MNWIQTSENAGIDLDHFMGYRVLDNGEVELQRATVEHDTWRLSGEHAAAVLKAVGHVAPGTESADIECPTCEGNGYTMSAVSAVRVRCAFCKGSGKATT